MSRLSFRQWHERMQAEHELLEQSGVKDFSLWKWCDRGCKACRWFDTIGYQEYVCRCCLKFKTFKVLGTLTLITIFAYIFMYSNSHEELLPGGTIFFFFLLFIASYTLGFIAMFVGLPPVLGYLLIGVICGNLPRSWMPSYDEGWALSFTKNVEKFIGLIAIIRGGLLLNLSRIKGRVQFILRISMVPSLCEFAMIWLVAHYLLDLPWEWSSLLGSIISMVSLATVTSIMEKNRQSGYGEDKHLSTVLIAASALEIIYGVFFYAMSLGYLFSAGDSPNQNIWNLTILLVLQIFVGLSVGIFCGFLIAFFPDKRNNRAATIRIIVLGMGAFAVASICHDYEMDAAGVLGSITLCSIASNMWEEMGWHENNNPVQFFYTTVYYVCQPIALPLFGLSVNFTHSNASEIALSIAVIILGLLARVATCFCITWGKLYPTSIKEKIFICIAWFSKGTFQAILAFPIEYMEPTNFDRDGDFDRHVERIKQTVLLGIFITIPWSHLGLTLLTPVLLSKPDSVLQNSDPENG